MDEVAEEEGQPPNYHTASSLTSECGTRVDANRTSTSEPERDAGSNSNETRVGAGAKAGTDSETDVEIGSDDETIAEDAAPSDLAMVLLGRLRGGGAAGPFRGPARRRRAGSRREAGGRGADRDQWSGAGPDRLDPVPVGAVLAGFVAERGWDTTMAEARVVADWAGIVGPEVAARCTPVALRAGELHLSAESTAWATQLRMLAATMVTRIEAQIGPGVVRRITVTGPVGPSWRHGPRTVQGARGPRDTYG